MTEYDHEANPDRLRGILAEAQSNREFDRVARFSFNVDESQITPLLTEAAQEEARSLARSAGAGSLSLSVLFGQRKGTYAGEFGLEALASMTEHDIDSNPEFLPEEYEKAESGKEFERLGLVELEVDEAAVLAVLYPEAKPLPAKVIGVST